MQTHKNINLLKNEEEENSHQHSHDYVAQLLAGKRCEGGENQN
jgi:hypothetical protein